MISTRDASNILHANHAAAIDQSDTSPLIVSTQELVCEHEIRNIHCACQDADDLTHFAYITKDHSSKDHYCHVFCVKTMVFILLLINLLC